MKPGLKSAVFDILVNQKWFVEEHLLRFGLADTVLAEAFPCVALVPQKANNPSWIGHVLYIKTIHIEAGRRGDCPPSCVLPRREKVTVPFSRPRSLKSAESSTRRECKLRLPS